MVAAVGPRSQTVSICTPANRRGEYEVKYRILGRAPVVPADISAHGAVEELLGWLNGLGASARLDTLIRWRLEPTVERTSRAERATSPDCFGLAA